MGALMRRRRIVVSLVLGVVLVLLQLLLTRTGIAVALVTGAVAVVLSYVVLLVADRYSRRD
jgi:hypothetical protein